MSTETDGLTEAELRWFETVKPPRSWCENWMWQHLLAAARKWLEADKCDCPKDHVPGCGTPIYGYGSNPAQQQGYKISDGAMYAHFSQGNVPNEIIEAYLKDRLPTEAAPMGEKPWKDDPCCPICGKYDTPDPECPLHGKPSPQADAAMEIAELKRELETKARQINDYFAYPMKRAASLIEGQAAEIEIQRDGWKDAALRCNELQAEIERQAAEIEKLNYTIDGALGRAYASQLRADEAQAEIERLKSPDPSPQGIEVGELVDRLDAASHDERLSTGALYRDAASLIKKKDSEIDDILMEAARLRVMIDYQAAELKRLEGLSYYGPYLRAQDEIERLREALENIEGAAILLREACEQKDPHRELLIRVREIQAFIDGSLRAPLADKPDET